MHDGKAHWKSSRLRVLVDVFSIGLVVQGVNYQTQARVNDTTQVSEIYWSTFIPDYDTMQTTLIVDEGI